MLRLPTPTRLNYKEVYAVYKFIPKKGKKYTAKQVKQTAQKMSNYLGKNGGGYMAVELRSKSFARGWYQNHSTRVGDRVNINSYIDNYDDEELDSFQGFNIYLRRSPPKSQREGGATDQHNDCLYDSIKSVITADSMPWCHPEKMKSFLKLNRDDKIDIKYIPLIESKLKHHKINVSGDHSYISTKKAQLQINLKLCKQHYKLDTSMNPDQTHLTSFKEKIPYLMTREGLDKYIYDPEQKKERKLTQEEYLYHRKNHISSKYILIPTDKENKGEEKKSLKELYDKFILNADLLKQETWRINLYKTGTVKNTALKLFYDFTKDIIPDKIRQSEGEYILKTNTGAIIWATKGYEGKAHDYDFISRYPSLMASVNMLFPYKEGEFKRLKEFPERLEYGIYRCMIDNTQPKLFRSNFNHHYTHLDINRARELKFRIKLLIDNEPNALVYTRDKLLTGSQLFGRYVNLLFGLKQKYKGNELVKLILNVLWGALSERNLLTQEIHEYKEGDKVFELHENSTHHSMKTIDSDKNIYAIEYFHNDKMFKSDFARIKPFLIAKARTIISQVMEPHLDKIVRVHTDGFLATEKLDVKTGEKLGDLKYKKSYEYVKVINVNNVVDKSDTKIFGKKSIHKQIEEMESDEE